MVSSNIEEVIDIARQFAWWGRDCYCVGSCNTLAKGTCGKRFDKWLDGYDAVVDHKYVFSQIGYNLKPLDLQGSIGQVQLKKFDEIHELRQNNYAYIKRCFDMFPDDVRVVNKLDSASTSWFGVPIVCENTKIKHALQQHLENAGIQTRNYFAGNLLLHPAYKHLGNAKDYPNAYEVLNKVFFLGTSPTLSKDDLEYIKNTLFQFVGITLLLMVILAVLI
jgi:CDP-6-deoxy-D-xylo-4-hexulose-3-dehydrase